MRLTQTRAVRRGISLLEVMVALTILGTALIGMAEYGRRYARSNANSAMLNNALDLASGRVERVKAERNYTSMDTLATTESDNLTVKDELVASQQALDEALAQVEELTGQADGLREELAQVQGEAQARPPVARIVTPSDGATLPVGQPAPIVLVAGDAAGLTSLTLEVDGQSFGNYPLDGETLYARTLNWPAPDEEGEHTFTVTTININGCLLYTSPSPRDGLLSRMPSSA